MLKKELHCGVSVKQVSHYCTKELYVSVPLEHHTFHTVFSSQRPKGDTDALPVPQKQQQQPQSFTLSFPLHLSRPQAAQGSRALTDPCAVKNPLAAI